MKKTIITLILAFTMNAVNADATESNMPQHIGLDRAQLSVLQLPDLSDWSLAVRSGLSLVMMRGRRGS